MPEILNALKHPDILDLEAMCLTTVLCGLSNFPHIVFPPYVILENDRPKSKYGAGIAVITVVGTKVPLLVLLFLEGKQEI